MYIKWMLSSILIIALGGCATEPGHQQEQAGMIIGGILGGAVGSQVGKGSGKTVAIIAGTLAGAAIGGSIGRSMDDTDKLKTAQTLETVRTVCLLHGKIRIPVINIQ